MRILHVVTLHSPDQAFGGPMTVATNLACEMIERDHEVTIAATCRDFEICPDQINGVPAMLRRAIRVFPRSGFSGLTSYRLLTAVARQIASFDVVHVHMSRDLVTLPIAAMALMRGRPVVIQCHGMIDPSPRRLARVLDALATRPILRRATAILNLTSQEARDLRDVMRSEPLRLTALPNGVPTSDIDERQEAGLVVFAARLHARKRPQAFVEAAAEVLSAGTAAHFVIAGPDEGELGHVTSRIAALNLRASVQYIGALGHEDLLHLLARAAVYVLPSIDEPYPMTVLEALAQGTPAVVTDTCGLAPQLSKSGAGIVTDGSAVQVAGAIRSLLADRSARLAAARAAEEEFSMRPVVDRLEEIYTEAMQK